MKRNSRGFTLVEIAIVLVIIGLLIGAVLKGQELIQAARVRSLASQIEGVRTAYFAFQDRFRAYPGDYAQAGANLKYQGGTCPHGNGDGRIEDAASVVNGSEVHEELLVWTHLSAAGFLNAGYSMAAGASAPTDASNPKNPYAAYLQVIADNNWGTSLNTESRHNVKTGNQIPVELLAELDTKLDDGKPSTGNLQFSPYSSTGSVIDWGLDSTTCTSEDSIDAVWSATGGASDCGAASLLQ